MKDATGNELHVGDMIVLCIPSPLLRCRVIKVREGGLSVALNPTMKGTTPDVVELAFMLEHVLADAPSGQKHPTLYRVPDADKEKIVPKGD